MTRPLVSCWMLLLGLLACAATARAQTLRSAPLGTKVAFELLDSEGRKHAEADAGERLTALLFVGVDCPLTKLYGERLNELAAQYAGKVVFLTVDSNRRDKLESIRTWARDLGLALPVLIDDRQTLADRLGATRNPEVFLLDRQRLLAYHGRIDDQFTTKGQLKAPRREELKTAIEELLAGRPVATPETPMTGCFIDRGAASGDGPTWHREIHPIFRRRCEPCHTAGESAPFPLATYEQAVSWRDTIRETIIERRMPPWLPSSEHGAFARSRDLTAAERESVLAWLSQGTALGDAGTAAPLEPLPEKRKWEMRSPDLVFRIPSPFTVPPTGTIDYLNVSVDPQFEQDVWVSAAEVRPTAPGVVHHCNVYLTQGGVENQISVTGELGSYFLASKGLYELPPGMAKRVPAGSKFVFSVHYVPNGKETVDQVGLALRVIPVEQVRQEVATRGMVNQHFVIEPHQADFVCSMSEAIPRDVLLLAMLPHMHLRGRSFRYEAEHPDGTREILLDIPQWHVDWEGRFELASPKFLPAGTILHAAAHYDNSEANLANPDPKVAVRVGPQLEDEMFNAFYDVVDAHQDLQTARARERWLLPACGLLGFMLLAALLFVRRKPASAAKQA